MLHCIVVGFVSMKIMVGMNIVFQYAIDLPAPLNWNASTCSVSGSIFSISCSFPNISSSAFVSAFILFPFPILSIVYFRVFVNYFCQLGITRLTWPAHPLRNLTAEGTEVHGANKTPRSRAAGCYVPRGGDYISGSLTPEGYSSRKRNKIPE
jgi:hypothetical protein